MKEDESIEDFYTEKAQEFILRNPIDDQNIYDSLMKIEKVRAPSIRTKIYEAMAVQLLESAQVKWAVYCFEKLDSFSFFLADQYMEALCQSGNLEGMRKVFHFCLVRFFREKRINQYEMLKKHAQFFPTRDQIELDLRMTILTGEMSFIDPYLKVPQYCEAIVAHEAMPQMFRKLEFWKSIVFSRPVLYQSMIGQFHFLGIKEKKKILYYGLEYFHKGLIVEKGDGKLFEQFFEWSVSCQFPFLYKEAMTYLNKTGLNRQWAFAPLAEKMFQEKEKYSFEEDSPQKASEVSLESGPGDWPTTPVHSDQEETVLWPRDILMGTGSYFCLTKKAKQQAIDELRGDIQETRDFSDPEKLKKKIKNAYLLVKLFMFDGNYREAMECIDFVLGHYPLVGHEVSSFQIIRRIIQSKCSHQ